MAGYELYEDRRNAELGFAPRPSPAPAKPRLDLELQRILEAWPSMSPADRLQAASGQALQTLMGIVTMPCDPEDIQRLRLKADVAKFLFDRQLKVEETLFKAAPRDRTEEIVQLAEELGLLPLLEAESDLPELEGPMPLPPRIAADESTDSQEPPNQIPPPPPHPPAANPAPESNFESTAPIAPTVKPIERAPIVAPPVIPAGDPRPARQPWQDSSFWQPDTNEPLYHSAAPWMQNRGRHRR